MRTTYLAPTGRTTTYSFIAAVDVRRASGLESRYVRRILFTVNEHEDVHADTVDVLVQNGVDRPQDDFDFHVPARTHQTLPGILGEIHDYINEQERREYEDGAHWTQIAVSLNGGIQ